MDTKRFSVLAIVKLDKLSTGTKAYTDQRIAPLPNTNLSFYLPFCVKYPIIQSMQIFITDLKKISKKSIFIKKYASRLRPKDKSRFDNISHVDRKMQFLMGRLMIYRFLGRRFNVEKSGKLTHKNAFLSLSHSQNLVVLALSKNPVGVDTEYIRKQRNFNNICHFMNWKKCSNLKEFYKLFTQYEADYKLGTEFKKTHHTFLLWKDFILCVASPTKEKLEVFEYYPKTYFF